MKQYSGSLDLYNNCTNAHIRLRVRGGLLSKAQVKRSRKALCGICECSCGNSLGQRGPGAAGIFEFEPGDDGTVKVWALSLDEMDSWRNKQKGTS